MSSPIIMVSTGEIRAGFVCAGCVQRNTENTNWRTVSRVVVGSDVWNRRIRGPVRARGLRGVETVCGIRISMAGFRVGI